MKHEIINECAKNHIWLSQLNSQQYEVLEKLMDEYAEQQVKTYHSQVNIDEVTDGLVARFCSEHKDFIGLDLANEILDYFKPYLQKQNVSDAVKFGLWLSGNYDTTPKEDAWMDNDLIRTTQELYKEFINSKTK